MIGKLVRIELEEIDSPGRQMYFKVAEFDDTHLVLDDPVLPDTMNVRTETYAARIVRYPNKPEQTFFVKTNEFDMFDALIAVTEGDRLKIYNDGYDAGMAAGLDIGEFRAARRYAALPWWKRLLGRLA
ncbi:MAG: hypothetical protein GY906_03750 [bacterium]|nr:hypothetical protein [bacterium]